MSLRKLLIGILLGILFCDCSGEDNCYRRTLRSRIEERLERFHTSLHHQEFLRADDYDTYLTKCLKFSKELKANLTKYVDNFGKCDSYLIQHNIRWTKKASIILETFCSLDDIYRKSEYCASILLRLSTIGIYCDEFVD